MSEKRRPGRAAGFLAAVWTMLLTVCVLLACTALLADRFITDRAFHEQTALSDAVVDAQLERISTEIGKLADKHGFDAMPARQAVSRESVMQQGKDVITWWMGLFGPDSELMPADWSPAAVLNVIEADPVFLEKVPEAKRDRELRLIRKELTEAADKAVLPLRSEIITMAISRLRKQVDIPKWASLLHLAPLFAGLAALLLCGLIFLTLARAPKRALGNTGSALTAGGLVFALLLFLIRAMRIPARIGEISALLQLQADTSMGRLLAMGFWMAGGAALLGLLLILAGQAGGGNRR